jgi:hypothetical protein
MVLADGIRRALALEVNSSLPEARVVRIMAHQIAQYGEAPSSEDFALESSRAFGPTLSSPASSE